MENFTLHPFNMWILWASVALLVIVLIITGIKAVHLMKNLKPVMEKTDYAKNGVQAAQIKVDAVKEKGESAKKKYGPLIRLLPLVIAIIKNYNNDDEKHGREGWKAAAEETASEKIKKKDLREFFKGLTV